jgi:transcriptional antiterminator NusG
VLSPHNAQAPEEMAAARQLRVAAAILTWGMNVPRGPRTSVRAFWFAIHVRSKFEVTVRDQLRAEGFEVFLPTWDERLKWSDREKVTTRPLFPGYIFARFDPADAPLICQTRGVVTILSTDQIPVQIPDDEIRELREIVEHPVPDACCPYVVGVSVTVKSGSFAGRSAVISRIKGGTLLTLLLPVFGRDTPVEIESADVKPADVAKAKK